jgi:hypothetical protein
MELNEVIVQRRTQDTVRRHLLACVVKKFAVELGVTLFAQVLRCMPQLLASAGMLDLLANTCRLDTTKFHTRSINK